MLFSFLRCILERRKYHKKLICDIQKRINSTIEPDIFPKEGQNSLSIYYISLEEELMNAQKRKCNILALKKQIINMYNTNNVQSIWLDSYTLEISVTHNVTN